MQGIWKHNEKKAEEMDKVKVLDLVRQVCNYEAETPKNEEEAKEIATSSFLNPYTGASTVMTRCKHYSHLSCLEKYKLQQEDGD